ncbi:hypothetical protein SASPL_156767 [Salvia splendens]|uniref:Uncharacterized protein n=1 Tax=Salvia splendens TaxID=180675 RepID=A0A8X8VW92_SALSN|nr:protein YIP4b-like [Salvia splendens]KAG6383480.1 hypothetical protein SASPL_156767 [Salvia splendens]
MSYSDTVPLHPSSQSDIDEIENLIHSNPLPVLPARPPSPPRASIPVSSAPPPPPPSFIPSNLPPPSAPKPTPVPSIAPKPSAPPPIGSSSGGIASSGFGSPPNTLTEPVWDTVKRDLSRIVSNLKLVVFPNPYREDPGKALRDWDLWGPFFFIVFLGLTLSWSASVKKVTFISLICRLRFKYLRVMIGYCFILSDLLKKLGLVVKLGSYNVDISVQINSACRSSIFII